VVAVNDYPNVANGFPVDADLWFNPVGRDLTAAKAQLVSSPLGIIGLAGPRQTNSNTSASGTLVPVLRSAAYPLTFGRGYRIWTPPLGMDGTIANDVIRATITFTADGSVPTIASTILPGGIVSALQANVAQGEYPVISTYYTPAAAGEQLSLLLSVSRVAGTGTVLLLGDTLNIIAMVVEDIGLALPNTGTNL